MYLLSCVLVNNGRKESRRGSEVDCFFSFYVYIPLFLRIVSLHILHLKNETNIPFDLIKNLLPFVQCC